MVTAAAAASAAMPRCHPYLPSVGFSSSLTRSRFGFSIQCSDSSRGFGPKSRNPEIKIMKSSPKQQSSTPPNQVPGLSSPSSGGGKTNYTSSDDLEFEQRLQAIRKSALEQKKAEEKKVSGAIDYDAPTENNSSTIGLGT